MSVKAKPKRLYLLVRRYPGRVLSNIRFEYRGFDVRFDLPRKRHLTISVSAYEKDNGTIEVYETAKGSDSRHYWLIDGNSYTVDGTDPLPLLLSCLKSVIGSVANSYEGSFAEMILAAFRSEKPEEASE